MAREFGVADLGPVDVTKMAAGHSRHLLARAVHAGEQGLGPSSYGTGHRCREHAPDKRAGAVGGVLGALGERGQGRVRTRRRSARRARQLPSSPSLSGRHVRQRAGGRAAGRAALA